MYLVIDLKMRYFPVDCYYYLNLSLFHPFCVKKPKKIVRESFVCECVFPTHNCFCP